MCLITVFCRFASRGKLSGNLRVNDVLDVMKAIKGESMYVQAKFVIRTIERFMSSADEFITTAHVPDEQEVNGQPASAISHYWKMVSHELCLK